MPDTGPPWRSFHGNDLNVAGSPPDADPDVELVSLEQQMYELPPSGGGSAHLAGEVAKEACTPSARVAISAGLCRMRP